MKIEWDEKKFTTVIDFDPREINIAIAAVKLLVALCNHSNVDASEIKSVLQKMQKHARAERQKERRARETLH